jgi:hypothetical protein
MTNAQRIRFEGECILKLRGGLWLFDWASGSSFSLLVPADGVRSQLLHFVAATSFKDIPRFDSFD